MKAARPGHVWEQLDDETFLQRIGAAGIGEDGKVHPTAAGLLMFGKEADIVREFRGYSLEFQEQAGMPTTANRDASRTDAANRARYEINELKNLASKVESESPRFTELRERARVEGDNVYDVAVKDTSRRGMTDLFSTLKAQEEQAPEQPAEEVPNAEETQHEAEQLVDETVEAEEEPKSAEEEGLKAEQPADETVEAEEGQLVTEEGQLDTKQPEEASANKIVGADEEAPEKPVI